MRKAIVAGLVSMLVLAGIAGAQGGTRTKTVTSYCVHVETGTEYPSYGDFNAFRGQLRFCVKGKPGKNGKRGKAGAKGKAGVNGTDGVNGTNGVNGKDGLNGAKGDTGATGAQGAQGIQGETGATGPAGPAGADGPAGPTGPAGPQGEQGPPGQGGLGGILYFCISNGGNVKYSGVTPDNCDPGHDLIIKVDGVEVVN